MLEALFRPGMRYLSGVVSLALDEELCTGCGRCTEVCPHAVFRCAEGDRAVVRDRDACMECGACARNCPEDAISVDAGVGCASAVIKGRVTGGEECCCDD